MSDDSKKENAGNVSSETEHVQQADNWSRFSFILHIFLPTAGLVLFFKQKHILSRLLLQLDRSCVSVYCPSFSRREKLLKWAGSRLPETWSSHSQTLSGGVAELWTDGSLLCTLINSAIPGACPNPHRHWKKPPLHAQALAYKYLGVVPIFTENELTANLTISLERNFLHYLNELQQAINKQTETTEVKSISTYYIARGMGLYTGEQHRKTMFYLYPNMKNMRSINSNIIVHIRGPYGTYGKATIPPFHSELFTIPEINVTSESLTTRKLLQKNSNLPKKSFIKSFSLPFMRYHKKHMGDNIVIDVTMENDRAKVTYIAKNYGMYEINMISNGELISGCPFSVHILNNTSGIEENFENEIKEEAIPNIRKRKIISKTIDFIDEKMPMADLLRRYKNNAVNNKRKEDEMSSPELPNNSEFNKVDDSKNCILFRHMNKPKTDLHQISQNEKNKNKIIYDESNLEKPCYKKGIFKLKHNERTIDEEEEGNLVFHVDGDDNNDNDEVVSKTNILNKILDEHFNILEKEHLSSMPESHGSNFHNNNAIKYEHDQIKKLPKQNSESENVKFDFHDGSNVIRDNQHLDVKQNSDYVIEDQKSNLQNGSEIQFKANVNNNVQEDSDLIILKNQGLKCGAENEKYNFHRDNEVASKITLSNNTSTNKYSNVLEKHNVESVNENHISNLFDDNRNNFKTNIRNDIFDEDRYNNLEKQNPRPVNEKSHLQTVDQKNKKIECVLNENKQNDGKICKVNDRADKTSTHKIVNKDDLTCRGLAPNKIPIASTFMCENDNKKLIDVQNKQQRNIDNEDNFHGTKFILNEYQMKFCVNKIQIPEKFCESESLSKTTLVTGLDTKYFKNAINSSNKKELPRKKSAILQEDDVKRVTKTIKSEHVPNTSAVIVNKVDIVNDDTNNNNEDTDNLEHNEVKRNLVKALSRKKSLVDIEKVNAVPRRFFQTQESPNKNSKPESPHKKENVTSTICPDHIVPEVENEYRQMSVAERRKIFANQSTDNISHTTNSSLSENENDEGSKIHRHFRQFEGLSVLNYLGSLKQSQNPRTSENYSLCSTVSLPNINSVESDFIFKNSVKARKNFWEKMSSSSSSLSTNEYSPIRKPKKQLTEHERCRLIWRKPNEAILVTNVGSEETHRWKKMPDIYKSADDILSITNYVPYQSPKKYRSLDNSLDNCAMLSIDERKKLLLKQNYDKEKIERDKLSSLKKSSVMKSYGNNMNKISEENYEKKINKICEEQDDDKREDTIVFSPILDKIKKYDSALNLTSNTKLEKINISRNTKNSRSANDISDNYIHNDLQSLPQPQKMTIKSHFKRAVTYFKNLEEKSLGKTKSKPIKKGCRSYSLDIQSNKNKNFRRGGSLNLPNVSERFSINNLYSDVFGNKKSSFKGAANQSALVEALATFSRKENRFNEEDEDEDDIKYNIFKRKAKSRKRRSIRSIFDVYY